MSWISCNSPVYLCHSLNSMNLTRHFHVSLQPCDMVTENVPFIYTVRITHLVARGGWHLKGVRGLTKTGRRRRLVVVCEWKHVEQIRARQKYLPKNMKVLLSVLVFFVAYFQFTERVLNHDLYVPWHSKMSGCFCLCKTWWITSKYRNLKK